MNTLTIEGNVEHFLNKIVSVREVFYFVTKTEYNKDLHETIIKLVQCENEPPDNYTCPELVYS